MSKYVTTVTQKGQVTIPGELRKALQIKPKDKVAFELANGELRLRALTSRLLAGYGAVRPTRRPEDFRELRRQVEEEWGAEAGGEA